MNFKTGMLLLLISAFPVLANETVALNKTILNISPSVCIVKHRGEECTMSAHVSWETPIFIDACLYSNNTLLKCWENKNKIREKLNITLNEHLLFTLQKKNIIIASQQIKVNASQSTKYRRKLRSQWSLF